MTEKARPNTSALFALPYWSSVAETNKAVWQDWENGTAIEPKPVDDERMLHFAIEDRSGFGTRADFNGNEYVEFRWIRRTLHKRTPYELYGRLPDGTIHHVGRLRL